MSEQEFLDKMMEIMDTEYPLAMDTKLDDVDEWDSLSYITFLTMCKGMQKQVQPQAIKESKTVADLYDIFTESAE